MNEAGNTQCQQLSPKNKPHREVPNIYSERRLHISIFPKLMGADVQQCALLVCFNDLSNRGPLCTKTSRHSNHKNSFGLFLTFFDIKI